jgi:hypothetical protein
VTVSAPVVHGTNTASCSCAECARTRFY